MHLAILLEIMRENTNKKINKTEVQIAMNLSKISNKYNTFIYRNLNKQIILNRISRSTGRPACLRSYRNGRFLSHNALATNLDASE